MAWMNDPFSRGDKRAKWRQRMLWLDGWIDSSLHEAGHGFLEFYERLCNFMRRFRAEGLWRGFFELVTERLARIERRVG